MSIQGRLKCTWGNMGMHISNTYSTVASTMKARKMHVCTPKVYALRKCPTSAVTKASTRTSKKRYQKDMEGKRENHSSTRAWYITYQIYTTINKNYERVTEADTHEIPKLYALKRAKKERGIFLLGELISPFTWALQKCYMIDMIMLHKSKILNKNKSNKIDCSLQAYNRTTSCL